MKMLELVEALVKLLKSSVDSRLVKLLSSLLLLLTSVLLRFLMLVNSMLRLAELLSKLLVQKLVHS